MTGLRQFADAASGLAFESDLFADSANQIGVWRARTNALVCPAACQNRAGFARAAARSGDRGWPVLFRPTGGGAAPQGPGALNFVVSVTVGEGFRMERGYQLLIQPVRAALGHDGRKLAVGAVNNSFCDGRWNLSIGGKKVAGAAQRWRRAGRGKTRILAHAVILTDGAIIPGVAAVGALHRDLRLGPVRAESHTTLDDEIGPPAQNMAEFAAELRRAALRGIAALERG